MPPPTDTDSVVAIELARLSGRVDTLLDQHERRLNELDARGRGAGARIAQVSGVLISLAAFLFVLLDRVQWEG